MSERKLTNLKLVSPVLMWAIILAGVALAYMFAPARLIFSSNIFWSSLIIPGAIYWLYFFFGASAVNRKMALSADKIDRIVTEGVYDMVRHPIYSGDIILAWTIFLYYPDYRLFFSVVWLTIVMISWVAVEEGALTLKFGQQYQDYKKAVPKFIPKLKK